jgi:hypothetical protein
MAHALEIRRALEHLHTDRIVLVIEPSVATGLAELFVRVGAQRYGAPRSVLVHG